MSHTHVPVPKSLLQKGDFNSYTDEGDARKQALHRDGKKFLKQIAEALGLGAPDYDLRSNKAGVAVSGEVTLHTNELYLQMSESFSSPSLQILYRTCQGRADYTGGTNNHIAVSTLADPNEQARFMARLVAMSPTAKAAATRTQVVDSLNTNAAEARRPSLPRPRI